MSDGDCDNAKTSSSEGEGHNIKISIALKNKRGLHARASAKFCAEASKWDAKITVSKDGYSAGGSSIMGLLTLGAGIGSEIHIEASGPQARLAIDGLTELIETRFGEDQ